MIFALFNSRTVLHAACWAGAWLLVFVAPEKAKAHLELYHNIEVNFTTTGKTGAVRLYFTIHAPELLVGFDKAGAEVFDAEWLRSRSDEEFQILFERSRSFVKERFRFRVDGGQALDLARQLHFEKPETIRSPSYRSGVPVGCLLVAADLELEPGAKVLEVALSEKAGKRLLLVINRRGEFPEAKDMDIGDKVVLALPVQNNDKDEKRQ